MLINFEKINKYQLFTNIFDKRFQEKIWVPLKCLKIGYLRPNFQTSNYQILSKKNNIQPYFLNRLEDLPVIYVTYFLRTI